jgi:hypothetical protein
MAGAFIFNKEASMKKARIFSKPSRGCFLTALGNQRLLFAENYLLKTGD